jgi:large subunit ribosomal protein L9
MRVILKQDVENVGRRGDILNVSPGFGRNYLIPQKLALEVTSSNLKVIEIEKEHLKMKNEQERLSFQEIIQKLNQLTLTFIRKAGEKDVIFGSVSAPDIKEALDKLGFDIDKKKIVLADPLKRLGNYTVPVKVYHDDKAEIRVEIKKEEEVTAEEKKKENEDGQGKEKLETKAKTGEEEEKKGRD